MDTDNSKTSWWVQNLRICGKIMLKNRLAMAEIWKDLLFDYHLEKPRSPLKDFEDTQNANSEFRW